MDVRRQAVGRASKRGNRNLWSIDTNTRRMVPVTEGKDFDIYPTAAENGVAMHFPRTVRATTRSGVSPKTGVIFGGLPVAISWRWIRLEFGRQNGDL